MLQRRQRMVAHGRFQFTLPHRNAVPSHLCQFLLCLPVTLYVSCYLPRPILPVGIWNPAALRILNIVIPLAIRREGRDEAYIVPMPEASIHEYARPVLPLHQVWVSRQPLMIQPIPESSTPQPTAHNNLRLSVFRPYRRHVLVSLFLGEFIHVVIRFSLSHKGSRNKPKCKNFSCFF